MKARIAASVVAISQMPVGPSAFEGPPEASELGWTRTAPVREALAASQLTRVHLDVSHAYNVALVAHEVLAPMREAMALARPFSIADYDSLPDLANALLYADNRLNNRNAQLETLPAALVELTPVRTAFKLFVDSLVVSGDLHTGALEKYNGGNNYAAMIPDVELLTSLLLSHAAELQGRTPFTMERVRQVCEKGRAMGRTLALRPHGDDAADALMLDRDRAVTLLVNAYDQVHRVVCFLRWSEDDASKLVPSLNPLGARGAARAAPDTVDAPTKPADPPTKPAEPPAKPAAYSPALEALLAASPQHAVPQNDPFTKS